MRPKLAASLAAWRRDWQAEHADALRSDKERLNSAEAGLGSK